MYLYLSAQADHFMIARERFVFFSCERVPSRALRARTFVLSPRKWGAKGYSGPLPKKWGGGPWPPGPFNAAAHATSPPPLPPPCPPPTPRPSTHPSPPHPHAP